MEAKLLFGLSCVTASLLSATRAQCSRPTVPTITDAVLMAATLVVGSVGCSSLVLERFCLPRRSVQRPNSQVGTHRSVD